MVDVSAEWILNQNSVNRKQGYVIITITLPNNTNIVISTLTGANGRTLKCLNHKRKYDPIGLALPANNITFDLYNFDGRWTYLYDNYEYDRLKVVVQYGYCLSQNETIAGGAFTTDRIEKKDDIISVTAKSAVESLTSNVIIPKAYGDEDVILFNAGSGEWKDGVIESDMQNQYTEVTAADIIDKLASEGVTVDANAALNSQIVYINPEEQTLVTDAIQYLANLSCQKCIIDREDHVEYTQVAYQPMRELLMLNMKSKPAYSRSNQLKDIVVDYNTRAQTGYATPAYNYRRQINGSAYGFAGQVYLRDFVVDYTKSSVVRVNGNVNYIKRGMIDLVEQTYVQEYGCSVVNTTDTKVRGFTIIVKTAEQLEIEIAQNITPAHVEKDRYDDQTPYSASGKGITCDINNPYGCPVDLNKIARYFSNRDIYDLDMRGDPSIDVGDYVLVELEEIQTVQGEQTKVLVYKKALVLESELTFDGSFKDKMKVRIIDNDFEEIAGNTHAQLASKTHSQLAAYTHKKLMTEVI